MRIFTRNMKELIMLPKEKGKKKSAKEKKAEEGGSTFVGVDKTCTCPDCDCELKAKFEAGICAKCIAGSHTWDR